MDIILVNKIQCKHCGDIIESKSEHDFKMCSCGKVGVDGGHEYQRLIGEIEDIINLSETKNSYDYAKELLKENERLKKELKFLKEDKEKSDREVEVLQQEIDNLNKLIMKS